MQDINQALREFQRIAKELELKAAGFEVKYESLYKDWLVIEKLMLDAYRVSPKPDAILNESPIGPLKLMMNFRNNLARLGWTWAGRNVLGLENVRRFTQGVSEGLAWCDRLFKDEAARKAAISEIDTTQPRH